MTKNVKTVIETTIVTRFKIKDPFEIGFGEGEGVGAAVGIDQLTELVSVFSLSSFKSSDNSLSTIFCALLAFPRIKSSIEFAITALALS